MSELTADSTYSESDSSVMVFNKIGILCDGTEALVLIKVLWRKHGLTD